MFNDSPIKVKKRDSSQINSPEVESPARQPRVVEQKEEEFLTAFDFIENDVTGERPELLNHLIKVLTGVNLIQTHHIIEEEKTIRIPSINMFEELDQFKDQMPANIKKNIFNTFMTLWGRKKQD